MTNRHHQIGLLLGMEEDWPRAFEAILSRVGPVTVDGVTHTLGAERLTIEPFDLTDPVRTPLVIDRLAHWYYHPREWLKKAAMVNGTYMILVTFAPPLLVARGLSVAEAGFATSLMSWVNLVAVPAGAMRSPDSIGKPCPTQARMPPSRTRTSMPWRRSSHHARDAATPSLSS